jgi:hypothetical protein
MKTNSIPHNPDSRTTIEGDGKPRMNNKLTRPRAKLSGQALVFIALSMVVIIAMVGLAVDGGAMYNDRRTAQNGTDASAMAGTRLMLVDYEEMVVSRPDGDDDNWPSAAQAAGRENQGDGSREGLKHAIDAYAARNGLDTSTVTAYFVNDSKQVVTVAQGPAHNCGSGNSQTPCQVGQNGLIPWQEGAKGIMVTGSAKSGTLFIGVLGWNQVSASANSTAFMGVAVNSGYDTSLFPVGFYTRTDMIDNLVVGTTYTLIAKVSGITSGNWGWVSYTANGGNSNVLRAWEECGFNAATTGNPNNTWATWCPSWSSSHGWGPLQYWVGWPDPDLTTIYTGLTVRFGAGTDGWWLQANSGDINSACQELQNLEGKKYIVPIFDKEEGSGSGTYFHLYRLAQFTIHPHIISCNGSFEVDGTFDQTYSPGSSGWHGDLRHNSLHLIFMSP